MKWISCKDKLPNKSGYYITLVLCRDGIIRTAVMKYKYNDFDSEVKYGVWLYRHCINANSSLMLQYNYEKKPIIMYKTRRYYQSFIGQSLI